MRSFPLNFQCCSRFSMNNSKNEENPDPHQKEWLNLSLRPYIEGSCSRARPTTSMKGYTCSFCGRKFYSPQALGGHQNGHRRERDAARRYRAYLFNQSMDAYSNLTGGTEAVDRQANVAKFMDNVAGHGVPSVQPYAEEESLDLKWPGSFYLNPQTATQQSDPNSLDLNLRLWKLNSPRWQLSGFTWRKVNSQ